MVPGGARGRRSAAVEHVDIAQVEVLALQDGAQLLEDVASRRIGRGGASGGGRRSGGEGEAMDFVVALEVALLSDGRKIARENGDKGWMDELTRIEAISRLNEPEIFGEDFFKMESMRKRPPHGTRAKDEVELERGRSSGRQSSTELGTGRRAGRHASRRASTPMQVARTTKGMQNAWAAWGVDIKRLTPVERRNTCRHKLSHHNISPLEHNINCFIVTASTIIRHCKCSVLMFFGWESICI